MVTEEARYLSALRERLSIKLISGTAVGEKKKSLFCFLGDICSFGIENLPSQSGHDRLYSSFSRDEDG